MQGSVLVVDECAAVLDSTRLKLLRLAFQVTTCLSAKEAVSLLQRSVYDILLLDIRQLATWQELEQVVVRDHRFLTVEQERGNLSTTKIVLVGHQCPERSTCVFVKKPFRDRTLQETLLLLDEDRRSTVATQSASVAPPSSLLRILLAEDNSTNQLVIKKLLASGGFHNLTIVENGKLAVDKVAQEEFDVVLMDMMVKHGRITLTVG